MAQIAGRAGRHQRDGSFGSVTAEGPGAFTPEEIAAIEGHHFPRLEAVYWREGSPDFASVAALIGSLDTRPDHIRLRAAAQALDRSEEHTSELQSLMRISYAVFCLKKKINKITIPTLTTYHTTTSNTAPVYPQSST